MLIQSRFNSILHTAAHTILKFSSKWTELGKNILNEVTISRKTNVVCITHKWLLDIKQKIASLQSITPENLDKRDMHGST